jgi:hypothetical protein
VSGVGSLKSPGKRGGADFSARPRQKACQDRLTRKGGDALRSCRGRYLFYWKGGFVMIGVTRGCCSGLNEACDHSSWLMISVCHETIPFHGFWH